MLKYLSAGESHGKELTAIVEGLPSGLPLTPGHINVDLARRQGGYGRGGRMKIEKDRVEITAGVRGGVTLGSPVALKVRNRDWENWVDVMGPVEAPKAAEKAVTRARPGHADLTGGMKYGHRDLRNVLERSSARETAARVAVGAVARRLLDEFGVRVGSWVGEIGGVKWDPSFALTNVSLSKMDTLFRKAEGSDVRCPDADAAESMRKRIDLAKADGDSLGGVFTVAATGVPPGLGSHVHWERKLDGRLSGSLASIQAIKGVEVGVGFKAGTLPGSMVHDEIFYTRAKGKKEYWPASPRFFRKTNNAGGVEGGMSNGEPVVARVVMKPIPTLYKPLRSVDIESKKRFSASVERSDVCAVPAAAVVAEAVVAYVLAGAFLEKFGGDSLAETRRNYKGYLDQISRY